MDSSFRAGMLGGTNYYVWVLFWEVQEEDHDVNNLLFNFITSFEPTWEQEWGVHAIRKSTLIPLILLSYLTHTGKLGVITLFLALINQPTIQWLI
jgi:hypothetical protein